MADPNLSELVTTTLRKRNKELADNVTNSNALLSELNMSGKVKTADGGRTIVEELDYAENGTFKYYSGYETLNVAASTVFSAAEFNWKQAAVVVSASGLEVEVQNTGVEQAIPLLNSRITNAMRTMSNNLSTGIYSDGTGSSGKQITGLQLAVADDPTTGTYGGINRANFEFWRNKIYDFSAESVTSSKDTIQRAMQTLFIRCTRGNDKPNLGVAGETYFQYFWESLTDIQRIQRTDRGDAGFSELLFGGGQVPILYDGDSGLASEQMYFLNTEYIYWRPHTRRNMVPLERRNSTNQDAIAEPIVFAGNLTSSNASLQGTIIE